MSHHDASPPRHGTTIALSGAAVAVLVFFASAGPLVEHAILPPPVPPQPDEPHLLVPPPSSTEGAGSASALDVDAATGLVKAEGWELVATNCTACHSGKLVVQNRGDRAHWLEIIRWMQRTQNLWALAPDVEDKILTYLSSHYGETKGARRALLPAELMPPDDVDPRVMRAQQALAPLKQQLMAALKGALPEGAPHAVSVCQQRAPEIAHALSKDGVLVGRTSHKTRNPKNKPSAWMVPLLDAYRAAPAAPGTYKTAELEGGRFGYVEPIYVGAMCLRCHGADLDVETLSAITRNYPSDEATGFSEGELRGLFFVELPSSSTPGR